MAILFLNESTRDNLLEPFVNIYIQKTGKQATVSQMKKYLLAKFVNEAYIRNLSLGSNYYLAGVARYYFNGDLTINKNLGVFDDGRDEFNEEVCKRLNALILILRNKYIDTVGTTFEQPEDFGTLSIAKLLRKYNKLINKELGLDNPEKVQEPTLNASHHVGNGYTYEILYSYEDATKYNRATEPGAWCITYGPQHYNYYIRERRIHYVIFVKDGYENVPREKGPNWTRWKPQDEYGNSMIALLQHNKNWEPDYITSRWNHGVPEEGTSCEADHAYTKEEFENIVGIDDTVLKNIYNEWKQNAPQTDDEGETLDRKQLNAERLSVLRQFKYAQMRINGGNQEQPFEDRTIERTFPMTGVEKVKNIRQKYYEMGKDLSPEEQAVIQEKYNEEVKKVARKLVKACEVSLNEGTFYFLMDGNRILFETIVKRDGRYDSCKYHFGSSEEEDRYGNNAYGYKNIVMCSVVNGTMLYDTRAHDFVTVDGVKKFKYVTNGISSWRKNEDGFYEVKMSSTQVALIDKNTNIPLKTPSGRCWLEEVKPAGSGWYRNETRCDTILTNDSHLLRLVLDSSAGISYLYDMHSRKFLNTPAETTITYIPRNKIGLYGIVVRELDGTVMNNQLHLFIQGQEVKPGGLDNLQTVRYIGDYNFAITTEDRYFIWNANTNEIFDIPKNVTSIGTNADSDSMSCVFYVDNWPHSKGFIFDNRFNTWIKNTINQTDSEYVFNCIYSCRDNRLWIKPQGENRPIVYYLSKKEPKFISEGDYTVEIEQERQQQENGGQINESVSITEQNLKLMVKKCVTKILEQKLK